jgi:hypothetical protein
MFDPTQMNLIAVSSLMFHRQDFREAEGGYFEVIGAEEAMDPRQGVGRNAEVALMGKYGLAFADIAKPQRNDEELLKRAREANGVYEAMTGEITWDTRRGVVVLDSARTQGVIGFVGSKTLETGAMSFRMKTQFGVVIASSLNDEALSDSERILVSTSGDARFSDVVMSEDFKLVKETGHFPFVMQPVEGTVVVKGEREVEVYALGAAGARMGRVEAARSEEGFSFELDGANKAMHYEIVR